MRKDSIRIAFILTHCFLHRQSQGVRGGAATSWLLKSWQAGEELDAAEEGHLFTVYNLAAK